MQATCLLRVGPRADADGEPRGLCPDRQPLPDAHARSEERRSPAACATTTTSTPPASWCCRTCGWWSSVARGYMGYGLPQADLIQEGNIGLMKAVKRFDPERGVRLVSFAIHWIKAEIHEYILRNWRMVKVATTKAQRKLFFNLRSMKSGLAPLGAEGSEADRRRRCKVKPEEVVEMETRLAGPGQSRSRPTATTKRPTRPIAYLAADARVRAVSRCWKRSRPRTTRPPASSPRSPASTRAAAASSRRAGCGEGRRHAARARRRVRRLGRAHPPDRGQGAREDAQGARPRPPSLSFSPSSNALKSSGRSDADPIVPDEQRSRPCGSKT